MTNPIIQLTDISASYDEKTVLSHINLTVYEHDFLGVIAVSYTHLTLPTKRIV